MMTLFSAVGKHFKMSSQVVLVVGLRSVYPYSSGVEGPQFGLRSCSISLSFRYSNIPDYLSQT